MQNELKVRKMILADWINWNKKQLCEIRYMNMHPDDKEELINHHKILIESFQSKLKKLCEEKELPVLILAKRYIDKDNDTDYYFVLYNENAKQPYISVIANDQFLREGLWYRGVHFETLREALDHFNNREDRL